MRRFWSILLVVAFVLPFVSPLFALTTSEANNVPACCRRNGTHHCAMRAAELSKADGRTRIGAVPERCPYHSQAIANGYLNPVVFQRTALRIPISALAAKRIAESERRRHAARNRARYTRGPPATFAS